MISTPIAVIAVILCTHLQLNRKIFKPKMAWTGDSPFFSTLQAGGHSRRATLFPGLGSPQRLVRLLDRTRHQTAAHPRGATDACGRSGLAGVGE